MKTNIIKKLNVSFLTKNQKFLIKIFIILNILEYFDLFLIGFIIIFLTKDIYWNLTIIQTSLILSGSGIGTVIGAILCGRLADNYGRKKIFIFCILIIVISTILSSITPNNNWNFLFFMRIFIGIGVGGINVVSIPYVQEFMPTKKRGISTGLISSFIPLGLLFSSLITKFLSQFIGWRGLFLFGCSPIFLLPFIIIIPESPRYLILKGLFEDAKKSYLWATNCSIKKIFFNSNLNNIKKSYLIIFKKNFLSIIIISIGFFCFIFGSFTIQSWGQILLINFFNFDINKISNLFIILSIGSFIGRFLSSWISDFIGRRWTIFIFGFIGSLGCIVSSYCIYINQIIIYFFSVDKTFIGWIFFIGMLITITFGDGVFGVINNFGGEMFSNSVRTTCLGLSYGIGSTAKIISPIFFGSFFLEDLLFFNENIFTSFFMFSIIFLIGSIVYLFSKETKNIKLEQIKN